MLRNINYFDSSLNILIDISIKSRSSFNPLFIKTNPISTSKPQLACLNYGSDIVVKENESFSLSIIIVDNNTLLQMPNISWNVINF